MSNLSGRLAKLEASNPAEERTIKILLSILRGQPVGIEARLEAMTEPTTDRLVAFLRGLAAAGDSEN